MTELSDISPSIQAIDRSSVHRICSGQVVLDLATAVKELVENSLDAGSSIVEVRLKEYGKDLIEVSDNGSGIEERNFEGLALKHHTSKLREFSDLTSVDTFGFRGEALSSLSALSDLVITTQIEDNVAGYKLLFDHYGKLISQSQIAREKGTSIFITSLFYTLPVRHKEFHRNFKKDFSKLCHVLYAYSLVNSHVRFTCCNIVGKKRNLLLSTKGNEDSLDIISGLFGATQSKHCIPIRQKSFDPNVLEEYNLTPIVVEQCCELFAISGYISSVTHGCGRSSPDRQFFFVNKRPCDFQKLSRVINEVYHSYNHSQYPFVFLEVQTNKEFVDINVTPDKRQIMVQQEKVLFALIKSSLKAMFDNMATYYNENKDSVRSSFSSQVDSCSLKDQVVPDFEEEHLSTSKLLSIRLRDNPLAKFKSIYEKEDSLMFSGSEDSKQKQDKEQPTLKKYFNVSSAKKRPLCNNDDGTEGTISKKPCMLSSSKSKQTNNDFDDTPAEPCEDLIENEKYFNEPETMEKISVTIDMKKNCNNVKRVVANFSLPKLKETFDAYVRKAKDKIHAGNVIDASSFRAKISLNDNSAAEEELKKHVSKETFSKMKILGQFNLGFIIGKLKHDLFIIDQHASDEKYNFETLQQKHILKPQRLIQPLTLEITPAQESVLLDNMEIFKKNGFDFDISETNDNNIVKLVSVPTHRNWSFGVNDVEELIFMLSDSPGITCRPSRVRQMFASRACRTSIMVGTALTVSAMKKLLKHMGEIDHPWNCPHGRPTMRHLINLQRIISS